ncbi:ATP-binding cassette domain-containing protein [Nocardia lasii]|uniref:ABC transporter ATP-binding protein/permease n=1 Tax=Nocardia lasii TaxID=1616107 RepID=UPI00367302A2
MGLVVVLAVVGAWFAPHPPERAVGMPFARPGGGALLGTDRLGRDVFSHLLTGGARLLVVSVVIAVVVTGLSAVLGAVAAVRPRAGRVIEIGGDLVILLPAVLGILLVLTAWPQGGVAAVIVVALIFGVPYCARIFAAAAAPVAATGYVEAAVACGESLPHLVFREILPNLRAVLTTQLGLRFVVAIYLVSTISFLGAPALGPDNWATMVRDNAAGLLLNPWSVLAPSAAIAIVAVGVNLVVTGVPERRKAAGGQVGSARVTGSAGVLKGSAGASEGSAIVPERSAGVPEGSAGVPEGSVGVSEGSAGVPEGSAGVPEGSAGVSEGRRPSLLARIRTIASAGADGSGTSVGRNGDLGGYGTSGVGDTVVVEGLTVATEGGVVLSAPLSFRLKAGSVTALTGASGVGKSTVMRALLGHLPAGARAAGEVSVAGRAVFALEPAALREFRRERIAYVGQDPGSELNPLRRVRAVLADAAPNSTAAERQAVLERVGLDRTHLRRRCAHLSGGQQRRVALARAILRRPEILVLDEPLAGLHGTLRTDIAHLITTLATENATTVLLSGHDTATITTIADTVIELRPPTDHPTNTTPNSAGTPKDSAERPAPRPSGAHLEEPGTRPRAMVDAGSRRVGAPTGDPETVARQAGAAVARVDAGRWGSRASTDPPELAGPQSGSGMVGTEKSPGSAEDEPIILSARDIRALAGGRVVLEDVGFTLRRGAALAVVGPSGAGKTTLARVIAGLHTAADGVLEVLGRQQKPGRHRRIKPVTNGIQLVTQNPRAALNPRRTVEQTLARPLRRIARVPERDLHTHITALLTAVDLPSTLTTRRPHELSGGQRQRVALARALAANPAVLICDEITTALDPATAAAIMALLDRVRAERGTAVLLISHDMTLVRGHCTDLLVLDQGRVVEAGTPTTVLAAPVHRATAELLG